MARHLAIDWDYQQLRVVAATVRGGELRIEQAAAWEEEQSPCIAEAAALGRHLRERLKAAGIAPGPVLACVGRDRVILREVRYPSVAAAEEPAIVRFQVLKELTDAASEVIIDYTPLGEAVPGEERRALVLTVRREVLAAYKALCHAAGLKLLALTPRPFGTMACVRESVKKWEGSGALAEVHKNGSPQAVVALLTAADNWSEFCLVRGDTLLLARSLPAGPTLAAEVRRNIATYTAQSPRHVVSGLYLAGNGENAGLEACLQEALGIPVRSFDPFVGAEETGLPRQNRGAFAGAVGLLRARGDGRPLPINFLSPKQPKVARDPNKQRLAIGAGIAAVLLIGVVAYCSAQLAGLNRELENLDLRKLSFQKQKDQIEEVENNFKLLTEWRRGNISWLDELYDLTALFPDGHTMPLLEFDGKAQSPTSARDAAKNKPAAQMILTVGPSTNSDTLEDLFRQMRKDKGHYLPLSRETNADGRTKAPIDLEKQPPDKFNRVVQGTSGDRPRPSPIRPVVSNGPSSPVNRNRIAIPKKGDMVNIVAPTQPAPGRAAGPAKNEPVQAAAPVAGVELDPVHGFGAMFEAVKEAHATDPAKAQAMIEERQKAQLKALGERIAPAPAAVKAAPPVASPKGNTP